MKAYYAHCLAIYDTEQERRDIDTIRKLGFECVSPNTHEVQEAVDAIRKDGGDVMEYFRRYVLDCDLIIFRALPGTAIPGGVAKEIAFFMEANKPVIELPTFSMRQKLDHLESVIYLQEAGQR